MYELNTDAEKTQETTKSYDETKGEPIQVCGSIGDFFSNEDQTIGNCMLYESGNVVENDNSMSFEDKKYKLVFYGERACASAKNKLNKGMVVAVTGLYRKREYTTKDGEDKTSDEIKVKDLNIKKGGKR